MRCARSHQVAQSNLKKPCRLCQENHVQSLHQLNDRAPRQSAKTAKEESLVNTTIEVLYVDQPPEGNRALLKVVRMLLHYGTHTLTTYAILDDGSKKTMLLPAAEQELGLQGTCKGLPLRTI
ncbi:hypothetical protein AAFF_G00328100 [Aldrovandia affinis]|uniref:Uncharacterized protein n=1 Tax=Aldrovandia affinis TaxID=143900 RepID=A0AAD7TAE0_9TELE|nr:hypothetical protein AAFF_G00328100 [Aldrovandia affinis]